MRSYKLLALDMDGTLLDDNQNVSEHNREWIGKAVNAGVIVMIATGRGIQSASPYIEELKLTSPIVTANGSEVWQAPGHLFKRQTLDQATIRKLHQLGVKYDSWYWAYAVEGMYNTNHWEGELASEKWLKFGYYLEDVNRLEAIRREIDSWGTLEITNSHPFNLELNPKGVNKAAGLKEVCKLIGIDITEAVAVGDSLNDLSMIQEAGLGVAMDNAQDAVKEASDCIAPRNTDDGVAYVIQRYILNK